MLGESLDNSMEMQNSLFFRWLTDNVYARTTFLVNHTP
jgi:hypothetical protein